MASNWKTIIPDVYMKLDDGWQDGKEGSCGYPVMCIESGTVVYNKGGLSAALGRAKGQNESGVVSKVQKIYKQMGLDLPDGNNAVDDQNPSEKGKNMAEKDMSLDANLDLAAALAMLADETDGYKQVVADAQAGNLDMAKLASMMYAKMCKMSDELKGCKTEMESAKTEMESIKPEFEALKKFRLDTETKEFSVQVENLLTEVSETMPKEEIEKAREDSKNFNLSNIEAWKNAVKANAYTFVKKDTKPNDGIVRIGNPFAKPTNLTGSPWKR
jgi:hypothetical protein